MTPSPHIVDITLENVQQVVLQGSMERPVLVDFWADWCAPCKALMPILTKLAEEYAGHFVLAKVNIDENPDLAAQFGVRSVPSVMLVSQGQLVDQFNGALPESEIRAFLGKHLDTRSPAEIVREQIDQLIGDGQLEQAQAYLQEAITQLPDDIELQVLLARVLLQQQKTEDAKAVLDHLPETEKGRPDVKGLISGLKFVDAAPSPEILATLSDRDDSEARYLKAMHALVQGEHEQALELLIAIMRDDRSFQEGEARKTLLEVFALLGESHPLVAPYRRKLFTLMY